MIVLSFFLLYTIILVKREEEETFTTLTTYENFIINDNSKNDSNFDSLTRFIRN